MLQKQIALLLALSFTTYSMAATHPQRIHFSLDSGVPTIQATIADKPVTLFLDLGAYKSIALTDAALARLQMPFTGQTEQYRDISGKVFEKRLFVVNDLKAGEFTATGLGGVEFDHSAQAGNFSQDGYLGFGLLMHYALVFDYPHSELRLYPPGTSPAVLQADCGQNRLPIEVSGGVVEARVDTDKGQLIFQLDTGSTENVLRPSAMNLGQDSKLTSFAFSEFRLGNRNFQRTRIPLREFGAPNVDGVLGTDFLQSKVLCVDASQHAAWIK